MQRAALPFLFAFFLSGCPTAEPVWQTRYSDDSAWLLAVAGLSGKVIAVGGQPGSAPTKPGSGLLRVVSDDDSAPEQVKTQNSPQPGMLWWVHTLSSTADHSVAWLCGENGSVLRYFESSGSTTLLPVATTTSATLYGIWAFSDDDVWAVGGTEGGPGVVLHGGMNQLSVDATAPSVPVLFKIWAADHDHLYIVGESGTLLRRVGTTWTVDPPLVNDRLLTAFGSGPDDVYAVGGLGSARLLHFDGRGWSVDSSVAELDALAGLSVAGAEVLIAGQRGLLARRSAAAGPFTVAESITTLDLHGALSRGGAHYTVGGNLSQYRLQPPRGVLLRQGVPTASP